MTGPAQSPADVASAVADPSLSPEVGDAPPDLAPQSLPVGPFALEPMLPSSDVQALLGKCERTLRRWEKRGFLRPIRVGRTLLYQPEDIRNLIAKGLAP